MGSIKEHFRLSGNNIIKILALNAAIFLLLLVFFLWLLSFKQHNYQYYLTPIELVLYLTFSFLISGYISYQFLARPLWNMEEDIQKHYESIYGNDAPSVLENYHIEHAFYHMLEQQDFNHEKAKFEKSRREKAEIDALSAQIDPHFLYNTLDSIRGYALLNGSFKISNITEALSRLFRNMISNKENLLPLNQELQNINDYMKIQQFCFNNKFDYKCEITPEVSETCLIPKMVLQPLVENAITHGLEPKLDRGSVIVRAKCTETLLLISVIDNGLGIEESTLNMLNAELSQKIGSPSINSADKGNSSTGIALLNINRRIKMTYGQNYGIHLQSTPGVRTSSELILPLMIDERYS